MRTLLLLFVLTLSLAAEAKQKLPFYVVACLPYMEVVDGAIDLYFNCSKTQEIQIEIDEVSKSGRWEQEFELTGGKFKAKIAVSESITPQDPPQYSVDATIESEGNPLARIFQAYHEKDFASLIAHTALGSKRGWPHLHFGSPDRADSKAHEMVMKNSLLRSMKSK